MVEFQDIRLLWISSLTGDQFGLRAEAEVVFGLHQAGLHLEVVCGPDSRFVEEFQSRGIPYSTDHPTGKWDLRETRRLRERLVQGRFTMVHAFNNKAIIHALRASRGLNVKVLTYRGFAGHIHWSDPASYLTHLHPRISGIWCVSEAVKDNMDRQFLFRSPPTVRIYKGQDPAWYENIEPLPRKELGLKEGTFAVVQVANYRKYKGVADLVAALRHIPEERPVELVLVGRDLDHPRLERLIRDTPGQHRVHRLGFRKDVLRVVAACDLAVNVSWTEALSKTLFEAIYLDVPCLATAVSGNLEMIPDDDHGWRVPVRDPQSIAAAVIDAMQGPEERARRAANARRYIRETFSTRQTVRQLLEWYAQLATPQVS